MLAMGLSGTVLALRQDWLHTSGPPGLLAACCVVTALTTVRTPPLWTWRVNAFALVVAITLTIVELGLARHLWRMCFALFLAAAASFSIREREVPYIKWGCPKVPRNSVVTVGLAPTTCEASATAPA